MGWFAEPDAAGDAAVVMATGVVVVVVVGGQPVSPGEDPGDRGLPGPLAAADPQRVAQRAERVPYRASRIGRLAGHGPASAAGPGLMLLRRLTSAA
jgi:hypothetical protein